MNSAPTHTSCFSCGGRFPEMEGPVHRYMKSTPGCWAVYGAVLAREYSDLSYFQVHRLTVDAYAVQHPGADDRQSIQSVALHLIRLCLFLEHDLKAEDANAAMLLAGRNKAKFHRLPAPQLMGQVTAADVIKTSSVTAHKDRVMAWAHAAWEAWSEQHHIIRSWLPDQYTLD